MNINPNIKKGWNQSSKPKSVDYYYDGIVNQDIYVLSEAISLIENKVWRYSDTAVQLLEKCYQLSNKSFRIGITGSPGVGKSSFIEALGMKIIADKGKRVAVLAIDPSSTITNGSILGDKTRMQTLSVEENAFIRPSPSENCLGGVSSQTKEIVCLCEAAGYDVIMIETVGVGQSETMISDLVDMFVLLLLPGAGDEIQGIKRGIVEMADMIIVNKSDGERIRLSKMIQRNYQQAIHLFQAKDHGRIVNVLRCSSLEGNGVLEIWNEMQSFFKSIIKSTYLQKNRIKQDQKWFKSSILFALERMILQKSKHPEKLNTFIINIMEKKISPYEASKQFTEFLITEYKNSGKEDIKA